MARSRRITWALVALLALVATACGDDGDDGDTGAGPDLGDLSGETVEVAAVWSGTEQARFQDVLDAFAEETGATVRFTSTGDDIATVVGTRIEGGRPPDIAILPQPGLLADLADRDALQPAGDEVAELVDANYAPIWRELGSVEDELYGVWFKASNKSTVWYNTAAFDDAGVEPPETWDDFLTAAQTLADSGVAPMSIGGADGWVLTDWFENVYIRTAGAESYDRLARHEIPWTDASVTEALQTLAEFWGKPNFLAGGTSGALGTGFDESVPSVFTDPPGAAMVYEGDFVGSIIDADTEAQVGEDADFFPFPSIDGSDPSVVGGGDVAVALTDRPGAKALLQYLASPAAAEVWVRQGGFTSPNREVDVDLYPDEVSRRLAESLVEAETFRFDLSDLQPAAFGGTPGQGMWKLMQDFMRTPADAAGIAQQLEAAAAQAFGR